MKVSSTFIFIALAYFSTPTSAAEPTSNNSEADRLKRESYISNLEQRLNSNTNATRIVAINEALSDSDPGVRRMAISKLLSRLSSLTPEYQIPDGSDIERHTLPKISIMGIQWKNESSFVGAIDHGVHNEVRGTVTDGKLSLEFSGVRVMEKLLSDKTNTDSRTQENLVFTSCTANLGVSSSKQDFEGNLECQGMRIQPRIRISFY